MGVDRTVEPLISVIVPVYKVEDYLRRCVESILAQSYEHLEIILVDDGSPDNCPQICDDFAKKDKRVKVIHQKNGGLSDARNAGIAACKGKKICFIDSDDYVSPNFVKILYEKARREHAPISLCNFYRVAEDGSQSKGDTLKTGVVEEDEFWWSTFEDHPISYVVAWNKLYDRELFEGVEYSKGHVNEDEIILHKIISQCKKIAIVDECAYCYQERSGSIMGKRDQYRESKDVFYGLLGRLRYFVRSEKWELASRLSWILLGRLYDKSINEAFSGQFVDISRKIPKKYLTLSHRAKLAIARFAPHLFYLKTLKQGIKNATKVAIYVLLAWLLVCYFSGVYGIDNITSGYDDATNQSEVFFVGTSGFNRAISPMELYHKKGIASYNLSNSWSQIPLDYYVVKEYAKSGKVKLVVLDMETFFDEEMQKLDTVHYTLDEMNLDAEKIELIESGAWSMTLEDKISMAAPLFRYHDRWSEAGLREYYRGKKASCDGWNCYGYLYDYNVFQEVDLKYKISYDYQTNKSLEYLLKIKDYCEQQGIDLLLLMPPWQRFEDEQYELMARIAKENDLKYEDFREETKDLIDEKIDFANSGHLNISGAIKYSDLLADYLSTNYVLSDYREDEEYKKWSDDYVIYSKTKEMQLEMHAEAAELGGLND